MNKILTNINWVQVTKSGKLPLLLICVFPHGWREGLLGRFLKANFTIHYYRRILGTTYFEEKEWNNYLRLIKSKENKNPGYLLGLGREFEKRITRIVRFCKKYQNFNFSKLKLNELEQIYRKFIQLKKEWLIPDYTYYVIDRFLPDILIAEVNKKLKDKTKFNEIITILTGLDRPILIREEKFQILKIANFIKERRLSFKDKKVKNLIKNHIAKYGFLNYYFYYQKPYTVADIEKRIKEILSKDLNEEIKNTRPQKQNKKLTEKIVQELGLSLKTQLVIKTLKQWGYCLNYLDEAGCLITHYFKNFLLELAKRMKINYEMLIEMTFEEVDEFFKTGKVIQQTKTKLKERTNQWGMLWDGAKLNIYSGKELEKLEKTEKKKIESRAEGIQLIKGICASPGMVRSRIRVLESYREISKMKKGEILVTSKTTPKFVPAMEKASAIIVDEGGLLSHAAIVSRELKICCIVGAKIATKVLRDGDLVEVNADKGIVRILKRK